MTLHPLALCWCSHIGGGAHPPNFTVWEWLNVKPVGAGKGVPHSDRLLKL